MFPPMVSSSPPPSDDEGSGDEGDELGVADSSFDITGLSQKLSVCQPQNHRPSAAVSDRECPPDPVHRPPSGVSDQECPPDSVPPAAGRRLSSDEWGDFSGGPVGSNSAGPVPPFVAPPELTYPEQHATAAENSLPATVDAGKSNAAHSAKVAQESSIFSDSDSDSEDVDIRQSQVAEHKPNVNSLSRDSASVKPGGTEPVEGTVTAVDVSTLREEAREVADQTNARQNGADEPSSATDVVETQRNSEDDDFGDFGGFSAATESDQFGVWNKPVTNSVDVVATQLVPGDSPLSNTDGNDDHKGENALRPVTIVEARNARTESPVSDIVIPASNVQPHEDDFGGFVSSGGRQDQVNGDQGIETSKSIDERIPSPDDFGDFATPGEPSVFSAPVEGTNSSGLATDHWAKMMSPSDQVNAESSTGSSPIRANPPDDFDSDGKAPSDDFGDFAAPADDFGDFAAPTEFPAPSDDFGDFSVPADDFGDFSGPTDEFGDFTAPGGTSGDAWPPDGTGGGGGGSGGFADFGAVFAAPADGGSVAAPLESAGQLAEPTELGDDFGDFEDFQAPVPQEPTPVTDEAAVSSLLGRLFPPSQEDREPASVPLDVSGVWYQLREPDATAALQYRWSGCRAYTALLHALRVDASNIINFGGWGGRPGRFSYGMDPEPIQPVREFPVLEPTPTERTTAQQPPAQHQHQQQHQHQHQGPAVSEVPPAAFDWNGSGLKNPLESTGLERELLSAEDPPTPAPSSRSGAGSAFSKLMAEAASPALSQAASRVVQRIPDIDFMRAKVLMFPVRGD